MEKINKEGIDCWKVVRRNNDNERCSAGDPAYSSSYYRLEYPKGEMIEKIPRSLGIFCFELYNEAKKFYNYMNDRDTSTFDIIKIRGFNKNLIPKYISYLGVYKEFKCEKKLSPNINLINFINSRLWANEYPEGTVAFDKVLVLE